MKDVKKCSMIDLLNFSRFLFCDNISESFAKKWPYARLEDIDEKFKKHFRRFKSAKRGKRGAKTTRDVFKSKIIVKT